MMPSTDRFPPEQLRRRVHGSADLASFNAVGARAAADLLAVFGKRLALDDATILDFGCGCGRVLTHFRCSAGGKVYGTDIDSEAIAWCREHLGPPSAFHVNGIRPPLPFTDGYFDLVYSVSVFTHLAERPQLEWLAELRRIVKASGYVVLSTHGAGLLRNMLGKRGIVGRKRAAMAPLHRLRLRWKGFSYARGTGNGVEVPDFYGTALHAPHYIRRRWGRLLEIEDIVPRALNGHQDLIVGRRRD
ncbi:MAG: class I SAM-dependent methyltransferase [Alphaproteobacteria bacterium]|nr:class I SAM-dependent methyltransferase [Alphaproteobacteria bacterium]MBV9554516.1 class I SAM-dependent methyltransferase [Alphaproteobacteria bacterium]